MEGRHWSWQNHQQQHHQAHFQNPNFTFPIPNPNAYYRYSHAFSNPADLRHHQWQHTQSPLYHPQNPTFYPTNHAFAPPPPPHPPSPTPPSPEPPRPRVATVEEVDDAARKACAELQAAGESVTAWKVSQAALVALGIDSWSSLGFQMQRVPSLNNLMAVEGKINAFIHCFVGVQRITSLSDMEVEICKNEGVGKFEDLGLGPLVKHNLVQHYFSLPSNLNEIMKITTAEIALLLHKFMLVNQNKKIGGDEFLDFVSKKRKVDDKLKLGIHIRHFGSLFSNIRKASKLEDEELRKHKEVVQPKRKERNKRPLLLSLKKELDERFNSISQRVESFSSVEKSFRGKHTRFTSSTSEEEESYSSFEDDDDDDDDDDDAKDIISQQMASGRASGCPYPSATEEMTRLGLKDDSKVNLSSTSGSQKHTATSGAVKRKRKSEVNCTNSLSVPAKLRKISNEGLDILSAKDANRTKDDSTVGKDDLSGTEGDEFFLTNDSLRLFIAIWKERCRGVSVGKVLKRMLRFYKVQDRKTANHMYTSYPFIGILNVAISSIKLGIWDSIYDTVHGINQTDLSKPLIGDACEYENINVEPSTKDAIAVSVEDIIKKVAAYLKHDHKGYKNDKPLLKGRFSLLRKLSNCENWLAEQFHVKEFRALGYGNFLLFMEKHVSLLPQELCGFLIDDSSEKSPLEVQMVHQQLVMLLSQASNNVWENKRITEQDVFSLLMRQFPSITFKVVANGSLKDFLSAAGKDKSFRTPKSVIFLSTLHTTTNIPESSSSYKTGLLESSSTRYDKDQVIQTNEFVTPKDAIEVLLKAPMLSDLNSWSHWDLRFAPSLGPLVPWLSNEVKTDDLLCLVTRDGKVVRIDPSATADSFLEAAVQGSSFQTAVQLLSLFSVVGGQEHISVSLLKCHAQHAFKVISENSLEDVALNGCESYLFNSKVLCGDRMTGGCATFKFSCKLQDNSKKMDASVSSVLRFILDCLLYLPSEIHAFAADIFLSGLQAIVKDGALAILNECSQTDHRVMLHEVGLSLGVVEWINDYHAFCSKDANDLAISEVSWKPKQDVLEKLSSFEQSTDLSVTEDKKIQNCTQVSALTSNSEVSGDRISNHSYLSGTHGQKDASLIVESIRRDEFGLDPSLSNVESIMLKKQHARLGRALQCLSRELYSQDSHFILELVQNADDNDYPDYVEPTLTFILQDSGIIALNNEHGFTARNIRALCDIGSSTKKGSNAGYIGQKGIGFKSVFRITDAPEIHSNGFHVKFDIREGQIGFVLPTAIPPCDLNLFSRLASSGFDQLGFNNWNTCIVLPFRSRLSEGTAMRSIMSMFSDLHPSLLLFLHRLRCIKFRNMLEDSLMVMRKEIVGDGIISVSYGKEKMTWLVVSHKLRSDFIRSDVQLTEISMAFTLQESADGGYSPLLSQQPVFAFLPLRTYGLKFILQGNFVLPSSREEVDGSSSWNQWLLSEFPGLFVEAERSFCALPCFKESPGKAVSAFMSFVPLVGEVHGFFSSLPRMIISKLRMSKCLLLEGGNGQWVPPCKVLRGWSEQAQSILPHGLLHEHLGLGFLDKNVVLSDALAMALGVEEYGPKVLVQFMASLCLKETGVKSMGLGWLSSFLTELYSMLELFPGRTVLDSELELDILNNLKRIPFIPLSNGTFSSVNEDTIWIQSDASSSVSDGEHKIESFPSLYAKLRIVSPALLSVSSGDGSRSDLTLIDKLTPVLCKIGVQRLSAHEIIRVHILPAISDVTTTKEKNLMTEYVCFVMSHLNSSCHDCHVEREYIMSELQNKAYILTNNGFKRPAEVSVHFSMEFGNPVNTTKFVDSLDITWHEVDSSYLKHPITKALPAALTKWREFFQGIGVTDFVKVIQVKKTAADISHAQYKSFIQDGGSISPGSIVEDWECPELVKLLSLLSRDGNKKACEYLLEILDKLWDSSYGDKTTAFCTSDSVVGCKPFKSSFISDITDVQWVVSTMGNKLYYPRDLYYDCDAVRSVLGASAPYAIPKVKSEKLATDIGLKTKVTLDDILAMLKLWSLKNRFMASISQMSKLYTFIWKEVTISTKLAEEFHSGSFIFVPYTSGSRHEDVVSGMFLSTREVYWSDSTGAIDQMSKIHPQHDLKDAARGPLNKTLCNIYPGLHDLFVNTCGVHENPSFSAYLQTLLQLSSVALPSQAAKAVFQVLLKWADGLKSGSEDVIYIKESLKKVEFTMLPTKQDKWVSLHPSFGVMCWCDDKKLKKQFKHMDGIDFLYFGKLNKDERELFQTKVSVFMRTLGIPALSEVVSREAIYYGVSDSSFKASLVNWALPYAQRYLHALHPDKYSQLKLSEFDSLNGLQVLAVEQLFYRNVLKSCGSKSEKRVGCSCVLQDKILYTTQDSDAHALFLELSRLFFHGNPELHMANFLHMITTMAESGSSEDQTEFFILNSQKIPKLPDGESVWSLASVSSSAEIVASKPVKSSKSKQKAPGTSNWPPVDWKTAPGFGYARSHGFMTQSSVPQVSHDLHTKPEYDYENADEIYDASQISMGGDWTIKDDSGATSTTLALPHSSVLEKQLGIANDEATEPGMSREFNPNSSHPAPKMSWSAGLSQNFRNDQIRISVANDRALLTGRVGEHLAFKYFAEKAGASTVNWVNKDRETGLPYDLVIKDEKNGKEYIEVKATVSPKKNWLLISIKEWQFANEKGDAFSIAHVVLLKNNIARVTVFKNPVKLLEQRKLRLVVVMPTDQEYSMVS